MRKNNYFRTIKKVEFMKGKRFSEPQILKILKEYESVLLATSQQWRGGQIETGKIDGKVILKYDFNYKNKPTLILSTESGIGAPYSEFIISNNSTHNQISIKFGFFEDIGGSIGNVIGGKISGSFQSEFIWQW